MTDGYENASQEWTHPAIKSLVEQQTEQYGWQFLYMGADQDAIEVGRNIGIKADHAVTYGRGKSQEVMASASAKIAQSAPPRARGATVRRADDRRSPTRSGATSRVVSTHATSVASGCRRRPGPPRRSCRRWSGTR